MAPSDIPPQARDRIIELLDQIYGGSKRAHLLAQLQALISAHHEAAGAPPPTAKPLSHEDQFLIAYPDMVHSAGAPPLAVLREFLEDHLTGVVSGVHLLPFFPSSSDDGFSIVDYRAVADGLGDWRHIEAIALRFRLMADAVINHVSSQSKWFRGFLRGETPFADYFLTADPKTDLSDVVRPRDLPLLTAFPTAEGEKHLWTTFSRDQIDLNYGNPLVLLEIVSVLLEYLRRGIQVFRLDAVAFLWKEPGSPSIHLRKTHLIIQLLRAIMEIVAPWAILITETNVPHEENISYFGDGTNEAHLVYQFPLPPLVLYTMHTGDSNPLVGWLRDLQLPSREVSYLNFLASHDGIGLRPAQDLLAEEATDELVRLTRASGGDVTYRKIGADSRQPYELNVTYLDALSRPGELDRNPTPAIRRFLCAHSLLLSLQGVPAIYFHSLFGSRNDLEGVASTARPRSINRQKLALKELESDLQDADGLRARIFRGMSAMLRRRRSLSAFHPHSEQEVLDLPTGLVGIRRLPHDGAPPVTLLHNATDHSIQVEPDRRGSSGWFDLLRRQLLASGPIPLQSWDYLWLQEAPAGTDAE